MSYCKVTKKFAPATEMKRCIDVVTGDTIIVHQSVNTYKCIDCGKSYYLDIGPWDLDSNEDYVCPNCKHNWGICANCRNWVLRENAQETGDGLVCNYCYEQDYEECRYCGNLHNKNEMTETVDGLVCEDCLNNEYTRCENCNKYYHTEDITRTADGYYLCSECVNDAFTCDICQAVYYYEDNLEYDEDNCRYICDNCNGRNAIKSYGYKPYPIFHKYKEEQTNEYFGFEIEVDGSCTKAKDFLKAFDDTKEDYIYLKRDSSVNGFEIVTHPMTRQAFYKDFVPKLTNGLAYLRKNGFRGHNYAGIHIHVSNRAIGMTQFNKMISLFYTKNKKQYKTWLAITQRKHSNMKHWSSMDINDLRMSKTSLTKEINYRKKLDDCSKPQLGNRRYMAINTQNSNTIEFRIFNSNIRIERVIKNAQVIFSLIDFCNSKEKVSMNNYLKFIEAHRRDYKELYTFLIDKHIYKPELSMEMLRELANEPNEEIQRYLNAIYAEQNLTVDDNDESEGIICA